MEALYKLLSEPSATLADSPLNPEAAAAFMSNIDEFEKTAREHAAAAPPAPASAPA